MTSSARRLFIAAALALACAFFGAPVLHAQAAAELPRKEISEVASAGFAKLQPLLAAKDHAAVLALADQLLGAVAPGSYDAYLLLQLRAQVFLDQNKLVDAIEPLERARALAEANPNFYERSAHLDRLQLLAQLHYQAGAGQKTPAARRQAFERARDRLRRWFELTPRPTSTVHYFAATLCYSLGTLDPAKPDAAFLREAADHAREALVLSSKPDRQVRLLLMACLQSLGENARAAEQLEVLAAADPKSASVWTQLLALYLNAASDTSDASAARAWNLRALLALERAQAQGYLVSPKENYTRVALLFNLGRFSRAAGQLEKGLADGTLENSKRNWELLSSAYRQTAREDRAIDAVRRAAAKFPEDGALEFSLAQLLHDAGKVDEAYARGRSALAKPGLEKPGQARLYLAFLAYELRRYEEAARWIAAARSGGDVPASSLDPLDRAIAEALARREALDKS